jgi:hypothetical protein
VPVIVILIIGEARAWRTWERQHARYPPVYLSGLCLAASPRGWAVALARSAGISPDHASGDAEFLWAALPAPRNPLGLTRLGAGTSAHNARLHGMLRSGGEDADL